MANNVLNNNGSANNVNNNGLANNVLNNNGLTNNVNNNGSANNTFTKPLTNYSTILITPLTNNLMQNADKLLQTNPSQNLETNALIDEDYSTFKMVGGDITQTIQNEYLHNIITRCNNLIPIFQKEECELIIANGYSYNFYDKLVSFVKISIINLVNPDANKIMSEEELLKNFENVFIA